MNRQLLRKLVLLNDQEVAYALERQINDGGRNDGGVREPHTGLPTPTHVGTGSSVASMVAALYANESNYYQSNTVREALHKALDFINRRQHEDGTISLGSTNYNSPPDTAFMVNGMAQVYSVLLKDSSEQGVELAGKARLFLLRSIPAMLTGGGHTPNHRWVITAALSWLYYYFKDEALVARIEEWLDEGLDCTLDGEWSERSNGIYNAVTNISLIFASQWLDRPELLDSVRRNLEMMAYLIYEDGEVITDYSGRQDWGARHSICEYFLCYQWMAARDQHSLFATMLDLAGQNLSHMGSINNHILLGSMVMNYPNLDNISRVPLPDGYTKKINFNYPIEKHLEQMKTVGHHGLIEHSSMHTSFGAPIVRYKDGNETILLMTRTPSCFSARKGAAKLVAVSIASTFSPGITMMEQLTETETGFALCGGFKKGYYGPIHKEQLPSTAQETISPWYLLPHQHRPLTHVQEQQIDMRVDHHEKQWVITIESDERPDVITQVTLLFSPDTVISSEGLEAVEPNVWYWSGEQLQVAGADGNTFVMSGGAKDHLQVQLRNAIPSGLSKKVIINLVTPFKHRLVIDMS
ncbi:MAG TPA: hypothetical protein IAA29_16480 [Candidatus Paenibacillus intestinavium]|nr:hypothetical protein [Candidatus Paenibacillus intestinavium]